MANQLKQKFVSGAAGADEANAQDSFDTAMATEQTRVYAPPGQGTGITIIAAGCSCWYDADATEDMYKFWAFVEYQAA
jgi:hypothetical protein